MNPNLPPGCEPEDVEPRGLCESCEWMPSMPGERYCIWCRDVILGDIKRDREKDRRAEDGDGK